MEYSSRSFPSLGDTRPLSPVSILSGKMGTSNVPMKPPASDIDDEELEAQEQELLNRTKEEAEEAADKTRLRKLKHEQKKSKPKSSRRDVDDSQSEMTDLEDRDAALVNEVEGESIMSQRLNPATIYKSTKTFIQQYPWVCLVMVMLLALLIYIIYVQHKSGAKIQYVLAAHGLWFGDPAMKRAGKVKRSIKRMEIPDRSQVNFDEPSAPPSRDLIRF
jgi:hypothetical protein